VDRAGDPGAGGRRMTNLIVSRRCNQSCAYCFAADSLSANSLLANSLSADSQSDYISLEAFEQRLDYLDRSGIQQARFLGGEPTLHPQFPELVRRAQARGKQVIVFTNGWMPPAALAALADLPDEQCSVILNVSASGAAGGGAAAGSSLGEAARFQRQREVLRRLGQKAQPGCNLYKTDQSLNDVVRLIIESGCRRAIRVGLAQPVLQGGNAYLPARAYRLVGEQIVHFAQNAARAEIKIELDCGFVRCMFSEENLCSLAGLHADLGWRCSPIIDIDVDGEAFHCFPLAGKVHAQVGPQTTAADLREAFIQQTQIYRQAGIYKECSICPDKIDQTCSGGCLANIMRRFSTQGFHFVME
jgi:radical SAM protein with 4Fe4S-binding SPASM domain